jgi:hypothetical protein
MKEPECLLPVAGTVTKTTVGSLSKSRNEDMFALDLIFSIPSEINS